MNEAKTIRIPKTKRRFAGAHLLDRVLNATADGQESGCVNCAEANDAAAELVTLIPTDWLEQNTKQCTRCKRILLLCDFPSKGANFPELRKECRYCAVERTKASIAKRSNK